MVTQELEAAARAIADELMRNYGIAVSHPYDLARAAFRAIREVDHDSMAALAGAFVCAPSDQDGVGTMDHVTASATFRVMIDRIIGEPNI